MLMGGQPQTAGTAFEPVTWQQQLGNYKQLEGQENAWRTAEGSPWKPAEPGPVAKAIGSALTSQPAQRFMDLANFLGPGPKMPMRAMAQEGPKGIRAYHGSPHDFDRFDLSRIGTGEGAQVYGHGLYFAEAEATAKAYRDQLAHKGVKLKETVEGALPGQSFTQNDLGAIYSAANHGDKDPLKAARAVQMKLPHLRDEGASFMGPPGATQQKVADAIAQLREQGRGRMYEVNIKADPDQFLDWDVPLSKQSEKVRGALSANPLMGEQPVAYSQNGRWHNLRSGEMEMSLGEVPGGFREMTNGGPVGPVFKTIDEAKAAIRGGGSTAMQDAFPSTLMTRMGSGLYGGADASKALREAGIPGIRYKDQGSRGAEGGTSNYVVFDDKLIDIVKKYGLAALLMGGATGGGSNSGNAAP
jgi:hypothetical protein